MSDAVTAVLSSISPFSVLTVGSYTRKIASSNITLSNIYTTAGLLDQFSHPITNMDKCNILLTIHHTEAYCTVQEKAKGNLFFILNSNKEYSTEDTFIIHSETNG